MTPKVSVIVPVYNTEKYLRQCIDSLMAQTLKDVEYIFIENGSTDNCPAILESYAANDDRIHIVTLKKNIGQAMARNVGLSSAKGEYLSILDSDDFFEPTLLQDSYECAVKNDADIVLFQYLNYDNTTGECSEPGFFDLGKMPADVCSPEQIADFFPSVTSSTVWAKLFRRNLVLQEHIQFPKAQFSDDTFFAYIALLTAKRIVRLNKHLLYYRCYPSNTTAKLSQYAKAIDTYNTLKCIKDELVKRKLFNTFNKGFLNLSSKLMQYFLNAVSLKELSLSERYRICHELDIKFFSIFFSRSFIYFHSPQWFRNFWRRCKKLLGMKLN